MAVSDPRPITRYSGSLNINQTITGLTPADEYEFRLVLRNALGTVTRTYYGTSTVKQVN